MGHTGDRSQRKLWTAGSLSAHILISTVPLDTAISTALVTCPTKHKSAPLCRAALSQSSKSLPTLNILLEHLAPAGSPHQVSHRSGWHYKTHFQLVLQICPCSLTTLPWLFMNPPSWLVQYPALNVFGILVIWLHGCKTPQQSVSCPAFHEQCSTNCRTNFFAVICVQVKHLLLNPRLKSVCSKSECRGGD